MIARLTPANGQPAHSSNMARRSLRLFCSRRRNFSMNLEKMTHVLPPAIFTSFVVAFRLQFDRAIA
jgi:hypothetical protein